MSDRHICHHHQQIEINHMFVQLRPPANYETPQGRLYHFGITGWEYLKPTKTKSSYPSRTDITKESEHTIKQLPKCLDRECLAKVYLQHALTQINSNKEVFLQTQCSQETPPGVRFNKVFSLLGFSASHMLGMDRNFNIFLMRRCTVWSPSQFLPVSLSKHVPPEDAKNTF